MNIHAYVCIYIYMYVYTYIHTYTVPLMILRLFIKKEKEKLQNTVLLSITPTLAYLLEKGQHASCLT